MLQQYLTMLGSTVLIPFLIVPAMGGTEDDKARVISTIFFISGLITLLQTIVGDRLPIIQVHLRSSLHRLHPSHICGFNHQQALLHVAGILLTS